MKKIPKGIAFSGFIAILLTLLFSKDKRARNGLQILSRSGSTMSTYVYRQWLGARPKRLWWSNRRPSADSYLTANWPH